MEFVDNQAGVSGSDSGDDMSGSGSGGQDMESFLDDEEVSQGSVHPQDARLAAEEAMRARDLERARRRQRFLLGGEDEEDEEFDEGEGEREGPREGPREAPREDESSEDDDEIPQGQGAKCRRRPPTSEPTPQRRRTSPASPFSASERGPPPGERSAVFAERSARDEVERGPGTFTQELASKAIAGEDRQAFAYSDDEDEDEDTGAGPGHVLDAPTGGRGDNPEASVEEDIAAEHDPVDDTGGEDFREGIGEIKRILCDFKRRFSDSSRFQITKSYASEFLRAVEQKMVALKEAHDKAKRGARNPEQFSRISDVSKRAQGMGHCLTNICKNLANSWIYAAKDPPQGESEHPLASVEEFLSYEDMEKDKCWSSYHDLLSFVINAFQAGGYKREEEDVYARVFIEVAVRRGDRVRTERFPTVAWERKCSIEEFVNAQTRRSVNPRMWLIKSKEKNPVPRIVTHLCSADEGEFSSVNMSPTLFSFDNGVYDADKNKFYAYPLPDNSKFLARDAPAASKHFKGVLFPQRLWEETRENQGALLQHVAGDAEHPALITTPLDAIFKEQSIDDASVVWFYFSLGRMFYPIGERDGLQYFPYFDGTAGCGKSTIIKVIQNVYDKSKVGIVSNNIEVKFGLSSFHDKWICVAPEVKGNWKMEPTEFQSMASGESVSIAVKNKNTIQKEWKAPVALAGNELPDFNDISGSVSRRLLVFKFDTKPRSENANLLNEIKARMGDIIFKANVLYRYMIKNGANESLWEVIPSYFQDIRTETQRALNVIEDYMEEARTSEGVGVNNLIDLTRDASGELTRYIDFAAFKVDVKDFSRSTRSRNIDERVFELHKVKPIVEKFGCTIDYPIDNGRVKKTRISAIRGLVPSIALESERLARRATTARAEDDSF